MTFERKHLREHFFKYTTVETAKIILSTGKFRYTNPYHFNDPFDVQTELDVDFDIGDLPAMFLKRVEELVHADEEPTFVNDHGFSKALAYMRKMKPTHGFPRERLKSLTDQVLGELGKAYEWARKGYVQEWTKVTKRMRVFCVTESHDNMLMWSHYAESHHGVVIRMKVAETEEDDDPLWIAAPVQYTPRAIPFFSKEEVIDELLGIRESRRDRLYWELGYRKYDVWSYEKEWRVWDLADEGDDSKFVDHIFKFKKIDAIYFGCKTPERDIQDIVSIVKVKKRGIRFFKAKKHTYEYNLEFEEFTEEK